MAIAQSREQMIGKFKGQPGEALRLDNWRAEEAQRQVFVGR